MLDLDLFQKALALEDLWQVVGSNFDPDSRRLDLVIDFPRGSRFSCPECDGAVCPVHDTTEKLAKQLKAEARSRRRDGKLAGTRIRQQVAELDRKIKAQVIALEDGVEPELVSDRIGELRGQKEALEEMGAERGEAEDEELVRRLESVPDLSESLRTASTQIKRQVFEAFDLQISYDKREGRVEISATIAKEVADALENSEELFAEGTTVTLTNIAGAGFVSQGDARILERVATRG
ncbi:MAG: hypothetical protein JJE10_09180 [Thermoleophilia bacterium]|nr:hypothetical protein [Thermoleophilia bacterium]